MYHPQSSNCHLTGVTVANSLIAVVTVPVHLCSPTLRETYHGHSQPTIMKQRSDR